MAKRPSTRSAFVALSLAFALTAAACGSSSNTSSGAAPGANKPAAGEIPASGFVVPEEGGTPVQGGSLRYATFVPGRTLDPAKATDSGVGNTEIGSIFDALMRYDSVAQEYVPWQAESLVPNEDFTVWTMTLRDGITFSDGTPLDSAAVELQLKRTQENRPGLYTDGITTQAPDARTVVYTLPVGWPDFPYALSVNPGRIPSPKAVAELGDDFGSKPVGAGPFVLDRWAPGEEMVVKANKNYWGEGPYLDEIRFVTLIGDQARLDSLRSGGVDAGLFRNATLAAEMLESGMHGFRMVYSMGEVILINNGINSDDTPGHDVRVRQAIAAAIDTDTVNDVVNNGNGLTGKEVFGPYSLLSTSVKATAYDPERAAQLLEEAKADGYDGKISLTCDSSPERESQALALQAQLNAVGFEMTIDKVTSVSDIMRKVQQEHSYELACYGYSAEDIAPYLGVLQVIGGTNQTGYTNPAADDLLLSLRTAADPETLRSTLDELQTLMNETQPLVPLAAVREFSAWGDAVHGMDFSAYGMPVFNGAWITK